MISNLVLYIVICDKMQAFYAWGLKFDHVAW